MKPNWIKIKNEYITTDISQRDLAKKHGVPFSTLRARANREKWADEKIVTCNKIRTKMEQKTVEKISDRGADRIDRILALSDGMQEVLERAMGLVSSYMTEPGLIEDFRFIDTHRLKRLTGALKDIKEIVCTLEDIKNGRDNAGGGVIIMPDIRKVE